MKHTKTGPYRYRRKGREHRLYPPLPTTSLADYDFDTDDWGYVYSWEYDDSYSDGWCWVCGHLGCDSSECESVVDGNCKQGPFRVSVFDVAVTNADKFECPNCRINTLFSDTKLSRKAKAFHTRGHCALLWSVLKEG